MEMRMDDVPQGIRTDVAAVIYGNDLDGLHAAAEQLARVLSRGATGGRCRSRTDGRPSRKCIVKAHPDRLPRNLIALDNISQPRQPPPASFGAACSTLR
jgi:Cu/Ag efflux pump CusA